MLGDWTNSLYNLASKTQEVKAYIEGPYGNPSTDINSDRYKLFILVSGGIGITPLQSIAMNLLDEYY